MLKLRELQALCKAVKVSEALLDYFQIIIGETSELIGRLSLAQVVELLSSAKSRVFS